jgi:hypothetical protein
VGGTVISGGSVVGAVVSTGSVGGTVVSGGTVVGIVVSGGAVGGTVVTGGSVVIWVGSVGAAVVPGRTVGSAGSGRVVVIDGRATQPNSSAASNRTQTVNFKSFIMRPPFISILAPREETVKNIQPFYISLKK